MVSRAGQLHPLRQWIRAIEAPSSGFNQALRRICAGRADLHDQAARTCVRALRTFGEIHGPDREVLVIRTAGRVNVLGTHIDHRGGSVNPVAVNHLWLIVGPREDGLVAVHNVESGQFPDEQFRISQCLPAGTKVEDWDSWCLAEFEKRKGDPSVTWSNYIRAAVLYLQNVYTDSHGVFNPAIRGMDMVFYGNIPRAVGLSSSSAVVVATAEAVARLNSLDISRTDMVRHCGYAEWYVGTRGGNADHAAIIFAEPNAILHAAAFATSVETVPVPDGYSLVLANSLIEAKKQAGARSAFNSRVAAYIFGLMLIKKQFPQYAEKLEHLRDVNPHTLGVAESEIYRMVRALPTSAYRDELLRQLPEDEHKMRRVFRSHDEPVEGYPIRQVCLYGITECIRADMVSQCLHSGDMARFGELMSISHDGDRVTRLVDGTRVPVDNSYPDGRIDTLICSIESGDPDLVERARLWRQGGGYSVSLPELDTLVDVALATPGVAGAKLVGAGMGGCIVAMVKSDRTQELIDRMAAGYYRPRNLRVAAEVITPVGGLHTFEL